MDALEKFLKYITIDTTSNEACETCPSSPNQWKLAQLLKDEMLQMGIDNAIVDQNCYVYGWIPANCEGPSIGLIAHMDTSPAVAGGPVKARIVHYAGGDIELNKEKGIVMRAAEHEILKRDIGCDLVVTDGTTLLGGDDKAGVAAIMALAEKLMKDPAIPHGKVCIAFTPDEEIGRGADLFDVEHFGADFAYTVDGEDIRGLEYENFNAASAKLLFHGYSIHPGTAKNKMVNAIKLAMEFDHLLPQFEVPEHTEGYEGFHHLDRLSGEVQEAESEYIIRDHDMAKFEKKKEDFEKAAAYMNDKYGKGTVELYLRDSYYNMRSIIEEDMSVIYRAEEAVKAQGVAPVSVPIRGGTDGARLCYMGLKCPNIGAGGRNFHGIYEYLNADQLKKAVDVLQHIVTVR